MYKAFFKNLGAHDTVITVNQRLAAYLRTEYDSLQKAELNLVWPSINILPFTSWLKRYWQNALLNANTKPYVLLSAQQEQIVWEQIIRSSTQGSGLLCLSATAHAAKQAWQLTKQWQINFQLPIFNQTEDSHTWQTWAQAFAQLCEAYGWLDSASLVDQCAHLIKTKQLPLPQRIFLLGFDEINPQYQWLFNTLVEAGCEIIIISAQGGVIEKREINIPSDGGVARSKLKISPLLGGVPPEAAGWIEDCTESKPTPSHLRCATPPEEGMIFFESGDPSPERGLCLKVVALENSETELYTMARWAQATLQNGAQRIACVIPNLNTIRSQVSEAFTAVFASAVLPPFNISAGIALTDFSLINSALQLLRLQNIIDIDELSTLLRSPYWNGAETEINARAQLDVTLRKRGETQLLLRDVLVAAQQQSCPLLAKLLQDFIASKPYAKSLSPSQWAASFAQQLALLGWPGERILDSTEYQLFQRWHELLTEFSQFDLVLTAINHTTALQQLQQLANATLFQPQTVNQTPIQILGVLESAGLNFDQIWVMGLHDQAWPESPKPNAFIPIALQRELKMPHASSERELQFCQAITTRLQHSAAQVIFSYPQQDTDRQLQASPLLKNLPTITPAELPLSHYQSYEAQIQQSAILENALEVFSDEHGPILTNVETVSHSTSIFKAQAACPFRAFAQFRLGAIAIESPTLGLDARTRGNLLHSTLEILWNQIGNHNQLISYTTDELNTVISKSIDTALTYFIKKRPLTFKRQFTQLEKQRLFHLLQKWLTLEKQRPPFTVIAMEQTGEYTLANMPLKLRVDRIDQLADGKHLIIDYKTGNNVSPNNWLGERPDEPQLPIYCVTSTLPTSGILFAQLRSNKLQFSGISETQVHIKGVTPVADLKEETTATTWTELLHGWQNVLEKLAKQFQQGYAKVDPKNNKSTCEHCDLGILCRVKNN